MSERTAQAPAPQVGPSATTKRNLLIAAAVGLLFLALGFFGYRMMSDDSIATLVDFSGQPQRDTASSMETWTEAEQGDKFRTGDGAKTPEDATAHFRLFNGARLRLKPSSKIRFRGRPGGSSIGVDVDVGEADVQSGQGSITIDSEFGQLVVEAGSTLSLSREAEHLAVDVEVGGILLNNRAIRAGENVLLELGGIVVDVPIEDEPPPEPPAPEPPLEPETPPLKAGDGVPNAELVVAAGETFVVHDPTPPTAVGFRIAKLCDGPARVTSGKLSTEAVGQANLRFPRGRHDYQVRCLSKPDIVVASGTVRVINDAGNRKLPLFAPTANVTTDGRSYTVLYQHRLPRVTVSWPTAPKAEKYTLIIDGRPINTTAPRHTFSSLRRGKHTVAFKANTEPVRQSRQTTIDVAYDYQAPAARVSEASMGFEPGKTVTISGQALPGWEVAVGDKQLDVDDDQSFSIDVEGEEPIPISFKHPTLGTHYYLRRPKSK